MMIVKYTRPRAKMILSTVRPRPHDERCEGCWQLPHTGYFPGGNRRYVITRRGYHGGLVRDHDHVTGRFRAWLCRACNKYAELVDRRVNRLRYAKELERAGTYPRGHA